MQTREQVAASHLQQDLVLELARTRQRLGRIVFGERRAEKGRAEDIDNDLGQQVLLLDAAVHLHRQDDRERRGDKGVLADRMEHLANRDLARQRPTVVDHGLSVAIPAVHWRARTRSARRVPLSSVRAGRTLDTPATLEQSSNVALDRAVADKLVTDEVRIVRA